MSSKLPDRLRKPALAGTAVLAAFLAFAPTAQARVTKILIDDTQPLTATGQTIPYQQISGRAFGELDPRDPDPVPGIHAVCSECGRRVSQFS